MPNRFITLHERSESSITVANRLLTYPNTINVSELQCCVFKPGLISSLTRLAKSVSLLRCFGTEFSFCVRDFSYDVVGFIYTGLLLFLSLSIPFILFLKLTDGYFFFELLSITR